MNVTFTKCKDQIIDDQIIRPGINDYRIKISSNEPIVDEKLSVFSKTEKITTSSNLKNPITTFIKDNEGILITAESQVKEQTEPIFNDLSELFNRQKVQDAISQEVENNGLIELTVTSDTDKFLSINWESYFSSSLLYKTGIIHKRYVNSLVQDTYPLGNDYLNMLFLLSYAHKEGTQKYEVVSEGIEKEVRKIYELYFRDKLTRFQKPNTFLIARYINRNTIKDLPFQSFNILHILGHGIEGHIGLESTYDSEYIDWTNSVDMTELIKKKDKKYLLIILSICKGANNNSDSESIAYNLIKNGVARNVIAFYGNPGSDESLPTFVEYFYNKYFQCLDIENAFREAVIKVHNMERKLKVCPIFYKENNLT